MLCLFGLFACEEPQTQGPPETIAIHLQENGGMIPYGTEVFLSNAEESYVAFFVDGIDNKIVITPSDQELQTLVKEMQIQNFEKIRTRKEEALDRGGNAVSLSLDGEKISVSNMGFSFVKDKYISGYSKIVERIYTIAKKQVALATPRVEIELDESLLKKEWRTAWSMNRNLFVEQSTLSTNDGFQKVFYAQALRENRIDIRIQSDDSETLGANIFDWHEKVVIPEDVDKVKFALKEGDMVVIFDEQKEIVQGHQVEVLEKQNLHELSQSSLLHIDLKKNEDDGDYEPFRLDITYQDQSSGVVIPLVNTYGSLVDTYADIHYQLMTTGQSDAPYLLFYSGQAGDEYNTAGVLVLFSETQKIAELQLNEGNRINAKIVEVRPDWIKVQEAVICHQPIQSTIAFSRDGLHRREGVFPNDTVYPTQNDSENGTYELKTDLEVLTDVGAQVFKAGETITMILQRVDFDRDIVFLKINEAEVSISLEAFRSLELVQSMAGAKCEMG